MQYCEERKNYTRNYCLDNVKVISIMAVIMIHVSAPFVTGYHVGSHELIWGNIFDSLSRIGVPMFIMTSGALMLDENKSFNIKHLFTKRLVSMVMLLFFWSVAYAFTYNIVIPFLKGEIIYIGMFFKSLFLGHYHLWYLYMQVGLYLALPFLRLIACKKNKNLVLLYVGISLLTQFTIPLIKGISIYFHGLESLITFIEQFKLGFFNVYVSHYLIGWYIVHIGIRNKKNRYIVYLSAIMALLIIVIYVNYTRDYRNVYTNEGGLVFIYSVGVFLALNNLNVSFKNKYLISFLSKASFGVYITHVVIFDVVKNFIPKTIIPIYMLICCIITFVLSLIITYILSKISLFKKFVRM